LEDLILKALAAAKADHVEIRIQTGASTRILYQGRELESIREPVLLGGCVRALVDGGWGFCCFNDVENLASYVTMACRQAKRAGGGKRGLAPTPVIRVHIAANPGEDPRSISLAEKETLCRLYNERILSGSPKIQSTSVNYADNSTSVWYGDTQGSLIREDTVFCGISLVAVARDGADVQTARRSVGDLRGFQICRGLDNLCDEAVASAVDMLRAPKVRAGRYDAVFDPQLTGVFIHEAFGHLSEADFIHQNLRLQEIMRLGRRFGPDELSVVDDATLPGEAGSYAFDAEGVPGRKTYLIRHGKLTSRLHSRETAHAMNEPPTGNARAISYGYEPIVRMSNTFIEPRSGEMEDLIAGVEYGIYAKGFLGGQTDMEMFSFSSEEAFMIRKGRLAERVRDANLSGNVFQTLMNIDAIGADLRRFGGLGGCGKGGQSPLRVSDGGPHIRVRDIVVGGE